MIIKDLNINGLQIKMDQIKDHYYIMDQATLKIQIKTLNIQHKD